MSNKYIPRLSAPSSTDKDWISTQYGGYNECIVINRSTGACIPNCVGYAWGRWREILGRRPNLSTGNAENWYGHTSDGYKRGRLRSWALSYAGVPALPAKAPTATVM